MAITVSHHYLRRTARKREAQIKASQIRARQGDRLEVQSLLDLGVETDDLVFVERAWRGPFRWRVVAR
jgi:hypothetical protein